MSIWQSLALGVMQGVSEFIPISSSGHLVVLRAVMGTDEMPLLYDVLLHIATLIVVVVFFRERVARILGAVIRWAARRGRGEDAVDLKLALLIAIATVVTVVIGLAVRRFDLQLQPKIVSAAFLVTAVLLVLSRFTRGTLEYDSVGVRHALIIGAVQGIAVVPGISRSGSTIFAALAAGVSRERAGEFSFLLAIPAILGALVLELRHFDDLAGTISLGALAAGFAGALLFGFISLALLVRLVRGGQLWIFSIYLVPLGIWGLLSL
jgi:undecaprenyl-diphosphatase